MAQYIVSLDELHWIVLNSGLFKTTYWQRLNRTGLREIICSWAISMRVGSYLLAVSRTGTPHLDVVATLYRTPTHCWHEQTYLNFAINEPLIGNLQFWIFVHPLFITVDHFFQISLSLALRLAKFKQYRSNAYLSTLYRLPTNAQARSAILITFKVTTTYNIPF